MSKKFQKKVEDFVCEKCGPKVLGNGYTNHCPECLYSKHVDVNPGDRAEECGGLMAPVSVEYVSGEYAIRHKCIKCGFERRQKVENSDNFDEVIKISKQVA